jgi:hypothetical protein
LFRLGVRTKDEWIFISHPGSSGVATVSVTLQSALLCWEERISFFHNFFGSRVLIEGGEEGSG